MFSSVQLLSHVYLFATPWIAARQTSLSITNSQSLIYISTNQKEWEVSIVILFLDRAELRAKELIKDKEETYIMIKGSILQENTYNPEGLCVK